MQLEGGIKCMEEAKIKIIMKENGDRVYNNDTRTMIINYESDMQLMLRTFSLFCL